MRHARGEQDELLKEHDGHVERLDDQGAREHLRRYDDEDDVLKKLSMNLDDITESPLAALRTIGEHNSQSYVDALQFLTVREVINPGSQSNATP